MLQVRLLPPEPLKKMGSINPVTDNIETPKMVTVNGFTVETDIGTKVSLGTSKERDGYYITFFNKEGKEHPLAISKEALRALINVALHNYCEDIYEVSLKDFAKDIVSSYTRTYIVEAKNETS